MVVRTRPELGAASCTFLLPNLPPVVESQISSLRSQLEAQLPGLLAARLAGHGCSLLVPNDWPNFGRKDSKGERRSTRGGPSPNAGLVPVHRLWAETLLGVQRVSLMPASLGGVLRLWHQSPFSPAVTLFRPPR